MSTNWKAEYRLRMLRPSPMINYDSTVFREREKEARLRRDIFTALFIASWVTFIVALMKIRTGL